MCDFSAISRENGGWLFFSNHSGYRYIVPLSKFEKKDHHYLGTVFVEDKIATTKLRLNDLKKMESAQM